MLLKDYNILYSVFRHYWGIRIFEWMGSDVILKTLNAKFMLTPINKAIRSLDVV